MGIQRESELSGPVKQFFESLGYEVKSEVKRCDLVAYRNDVPDPVIVELKKSFTLPLVLQGLDRRSFTPNVYLAVERKANSRAKTWQQYVRLCSSLGLGLITVRFYKTIAPRVDICCDPQAKPKVTGPSPQVRDRRTARLMKEFHERSGDYNIGGSTRRKIMTAYKEKALYCAHLTQKFGTVSPKQLRESSGLDDAGRILQNNYYGWFERIKRGTYQLTKHGSQALITFDHVVQARFQQDCDTKKEP